VGSALGAAQLILYFIYRDSKSDPKKATARTSSSGTQEEGTMEMSKQTNSNGTTTQEEQV